MTDETRTSPEGQPLQFDTAEPVGGDAATATSLACAACSADVTTSYYEVNGAVMCLSCRAKVRAQLTGGSGSARFAKAVAFGLAAAAVGSALYYAVLALTGYEIGLVAIVVGFLVGRAVNLGSQGRGGRAYQVLAVGLTYFAIVTTYIPMIIKSAREQVAVTADSTAQKATSDSTALAAASVPANAQAELQGAATTAPNGVEAPARKVSVGHALIGIAVLLAFAAAVPILAGFENIIGMLIIGFALFEAWRQNQRVQLAITGPYRVGAKRDGPPSAEAVGG
jgi:hypothetical protein